MVVVMVNMTMTPSGKISESGLEGVVEGGWLGEVVCRHQ